MHLFSQDQFANDANYELVCVPPAPDEKQIMINTMQ
jgi:hypothetical protein